MLKVKDRDGMLNLITALQFAISDAADLNERAKAVFPALKIDRNPLDRLADENPNYGEDWRVSVKQVGPDLLVRIFREVLYSAGVVGMYEEEEGEMFALFKRSGEVVVGDREFFKKELS